MGKLAVHLEVVSGHDLLTKRRKESERVASRLVSSLQDVRLSNKMLKERTDHLVRGILGSLREGHLAGNVGGSEVHLGRVTRDERSVSSSLLLGEDLCMNGKRRVQESVRIRSSVT